MGMDCLYTTTEASTLVHLYQDNMKVREDVYTRTEKCYKEIGCKEN